MMSKGWALWMLVAAAWVNPGFLYIDLRRDKDDIKQNALHLTSVSNGRPATGKLRKRDSLLTERGEWRGKEPNHTTARKPCRLRYNKYSMPLSIPGSNPA
jgi:hypothetical protein